MLCGLALESSSQYSQKYRKAYSPGQKCYLINATQLQLLCGEQSKVLLARLSSATLVHSQNVHCRSKVSILYWFNRMVARAESIASQLAVNDVTGFPLPTTRAPAETILANDQHRNSFWLIHSVELVRALLKNSFHFPCPF